MNNRLKRRVFSGLIVLASTFGSGVLAEPLPSAITDEDFWPVDPDEARLGQLLFYDPILSGNKSVACATCHHPRFGTSDGVSLSIGDGGIGLGPDRRIDPDNPPEKRIPRNSPALFNLGAKEFTVMFHDGRLEADPSYPDGIRTPMDADMTKGFASVLSAQTMFPVLSRDEMAGSYNENEVGRAVRQGLITGTGGAWELLSKRVAAIPEYSAAFVALYPEIDGPEDIAFSDISNAIAAFMAFEWRSDSAPFDAVLRQEIKLTGPAAEGQRLFYGRAGCSECHSGPFLTDHKFHVMGSPQIGPGKAADFESHKRDDGRFRVTGRAEDRFAFRTPSLRNVLETAPYGHAGAHSNLPDFIAHHVDPVAGLKRYDVTQAILPDAPFKDLDIMSDPEALNQIASSVSRVPTKLSADDISNLIAFLETMTDKTALGGRLGIPKSVPSGLAVP